MKKSKDRKGQLKKRFDEASMHLEQFRIEFTHKKREPFMGHAEAIIQPAQDYYNNLFHKEGEYCYNMIRMASAAFF